MSALTLATDKQRRYCRVLLQQTGTLETIGCQDASHYRVSDVDQLTTREANVLIQGLRAELNAPPDPCDVMRKKLLHFAHEMGWKVPNGRVDVSRVEAWVLKYGQFHKALMAHDQAELAALVTQLERVYQTFLRDLRK